MRIILLALLASAPFAAAQTLPARLEGHVVDQSGQPMRKVTLRLVSDVFFAGNTASMTDDAGVFAFEGIPPGTYTLTGERVGFVTLKYGATSTQSAGTPLTFRAGETVKDLVLRMIPQGVILGKVTNQAGEPISGQVMASQSVYIRGKRQLQPVGFGPIDDQGNFRIAGLAPGRYYVSVAGLRMVLVGPGAAIQPSAATEADLPTYYPGETDPTRAGALEVTPGGELRGIDFQLRRARSYSVRGTVTAPSGVKVTDQGLSITSKEGNGFGMGARVGADGTFQFHGLPNGAYLIRSSGVGSAVAAPVSVTVADNDVDGVGVSLVPGFVLTGMVSLDGGRAPATPAMVLRDPEASEGLLPQARFKADGSFTVAPSLAPAKYFVDVTPPPGSYVQAIRLGKQDATHALLDLTEGGGALDIRLSSRVASVSGSVKNGAGGPAGGATVTIWPKQADPGNLTGGIKSATADQNGSYRIGDLAPGSYYVAAWEDVEQGLADTPGFRARFQGQLSEVTLEEGARQAVNPALIPRDQIISEAAKLQ